MLLLTNISQLVTLRGDSSVRRGAAMRDLAVIRDAAVLCAGGQIVVACKQREILRHPFFQRRKRKLNEIDCSGKTVTPGLVDSHTHLIFAEPRLIDFEKRISGATYEQIAVAGGGIRSSVSAVRAASTKSLADKALAALKKMQACGTTTVEAKSGYGLSVESEIRSLQAIRSAAKRWPGTVVPTLLGAHVVPAEWKQKPQEYVRQICEEMIPQVAQKRLATFVDVFCERGAFSPADTERIFAAAIKHGLATRAHIGQFSPCALKPLLANAPASFDHMDCFHEKDLPLLAGSNTIATLVPGANYFLGQGKYPDARKLIDSGVGVALATDFNPGTSPIWNMQFVLSLACTQMKMSPEEAITAATINGAHALGLAKRKGSIESGKDADFAIFSVGDYRELCYWFGGNVCKLAITATEVD